MSEDITTKFEKIVNQFNQAKILVIGDFMIDKYIFGETDRLSPEAPVPIVLAEKEIYSLGGAGNVISNISGLNSKTIPIGICGNDEYGTIMRDKIKKENAKIKGIFFDESRPTTRKTRIIAQKQHLLRIDFENSQQINQNLEKKIINYIQETIPLVQGIIISDYNKGVLTPNILKKTINEAKERNLFVAVDPKKENFYNYIGANISTPNLKEASEMIGYKLKSIDEEIVKAGKEIINKYSIENILITRSADGMTLVKKDGSFKHIPAFARSVYDVAGAGDTVIATLTTAMATGANLEDAAYIANIAAGKVVEEVGCVPIIKKELIKSIKKHKT